MKIITASNFKKHYGEIFDRALQETVVIQKHNRNSLVMIAFEEFEKLKQRIAELEDYKLVQEMTKIKNKGIFVSGEEAINLLNAMIV